MTFVFNLHAQERFAQRVAEHFDEPIHEWIKKALPPRAKELERFKQNKRKQRWEKYPAHILVRRKDGRVFAAVAYKRIGKQYDVKTFLVWEWTPTGDLEFVAC